MLPASDLSAILSNLAALQLDSETATAVIGAVLAPLLRSSERVTDEAAPGRRPRSKRRVVPRQKRKYNRAEPRERAITALKARPNATNKAIAQSLGISPSTVHNARRDLAKAERKEARKAARETSAPPGSRRLRAQRWLKDTLASGPVQVSAIEDQAEKAHVDPTSLGQARADLGVVTSRGNAGGVQAVQWALPG